MSVNDHTHPISESCRSDLPSMHDVYRVMNTRSSQRITSTLYGNGCFVLTYEDTIKKKDDTDLIALLDGMDRLTHLFCVQETSSPQTVVKYLTTLFHNSHTPIRIAFLPSL
jgi:hypothetical protein